MHFAQSGYLNMNIDISHNVLDGGIQRGDV